MYLRGLPFPGKDILEPLCPSSCKAALHSVTAPNHCSFFRNLSHSKAKSCGGVQYLVALGTSARPGGPTFLGHVGLGRHQGTGEPAWVPGLCWRSAGLTPHVRASHWERASLSTAGPKLASASPEVHFQSLGLRCWQCGWCPSGMPGSAWALSDKELRDPALSCDKPFQHKEIAGLQ